MALFRPQWPGSILDWLDLISVDYRTDEAKQPAFKYAMGGLESDLMARQRKRVKHTATFEERLAEEAIRFKEAAEKQPAGSLARELLLRRARQAETAAHINEWLKSPGLRPPASLENVLSDQKK
jgi:hypothetical protein